jgi:hypothetical protein
MLGAERRRVRVLDDPSSGIIALEFILPLTEMSTINTSGIKERPGRKADNLNELDKLTV